MADRSVVVKLRAQVGEYVAGVQQAQAQTRGLLGELSKSKAAGDKMSAAMLVGGAALTGLAVYAIKTAAEFDRQMSAVGAVANATGAEMGALRQAAMDAGRDTAYSATQAAKAEEELAKAGMSAAAIVGGGLKGALSLAAAGQMDLADAATISATAMNMFHLPASAATHVADVFAATANKTAADMKDLGMGLGQVGLVAHQMGFTFESTTAVLGAFADRGLKGSDGATSLKTALMSLSAPTIQAKAQMQALGIEAYDSAGNFRDAAGIAGQLQKALGPLSQAERNAAMQVIFGSDAIRAANVLYDLGEKGVTDYVSAVYDQGAAARVAADKTNNLAGDIERLKGSLETLAISSGSGANSGLRILVQALGGLTNEFLALPGPVASAITVLSGVSGVALLAGAGFLKARQSAQDLMDALRAAGPAGQATATGLGKIGTVAGRIGVAALAIGATYEVSRLFVEFLASSTAPATRNVDAMATALNRLADTGKVTGELAKAFGDGFSDMRKQVAALDEAAKKLPQGLSNSGDMLGQLGRGMSDAGKQAAGLNDSISTSSNQVVENVKAVDQALADLVGQGGITQAKQAFQAVSDAWAAGGGNLDDLTRMMPAYAAATDAAATANSGLSTGLGGTESATRTMTKSWDDAIHKGQTLKALFDELNGAAVSWTQAQIAVEQANADLAESFYKNGKNLDITTQGGRDNMAALLKMTDAMIKATEARRIDTGSTEEAAKTYETYLGKLRLTAHAYGLTNDQVDALIAAYARLPANVSTPVDAPGLPQVTGEARDYSEALAAIKPDVHTRITLDYTGLLASIAAVKNAVRSVAGPGVTAQLGSAAASTYADYYYRQANGFRWGGVVEHAATGALKDAQMWGPGSTLYGFREPQTGGEAFIPRQGDLGRSRAIAGHVVGNWLGGSISWGGRPTGSSTTTVINVNVVAGMGTDGPSVGRQIADALRGYVRSAGGNVQAVIGKPGA